MNISNRGERRRELSLMRRVDEVCERFEAAWKMGDRPRIEAFLDDSDGSLRRTATCPA